MIVQPSSPGAAASPEAAAQRFASLFPDIYLRFHRRDEKHSELSGASRAVLTHLAMTGPLTVGEVAKHLQRAQSVVSEIVTQLAGKGLLERWRDPRDRRRTLVWLTPSGLRFLERDRDVLSVELLAAAFAEMTASDREALSTGVDALLRAEAELPGRATPTHRRPQSITSYQPHPVGSTQGEPMTSTSTCESCGMPIESGPYCTHCTDATGQLQSFEERFERMIGWQARQHPDASRQQLESETLAYLATMPAWRDHPRVLAG